MLPSIRCSLFAVAVSLSFAASADPEIAFQKKSEVSNDNAEFSHFCGEMEQVKFVGSSNRIEVRGGCASVIVEGSDNSLALDPVVTLITVNGDRNTIKWTKGEWAEPKTKISGSKNVVEGKAP